jgi:predicted PurR-regulated permease PerM
VSDDNVPQGLKDAAGWSWRVLVIGFLLMQLGLLYQRLELATIPLSVAILLTALLRPVQVRLERLRVPRSFAAALTVLLGLIVLGGVATYVVNRASAEYDQLVSSVDQIVQDTKDWLVTGPLKLRQSTVDGLGTGNLQDFLRGNQGEVVSGVVDAGKKAFETVTAVVLTVFLTIFLLYDGPQVWRWLTALFPTDRRETVDTVGDRMWATVSGYVTGTFLVATFHGVVIGVTLAVVGAPLVAPLAVVVFIGAFIPLIGAIVFGGLAVLVTLVADSPTAAVVVLIVLVISNQVESHVLQPFVVGKHVSLHPMGIAITLAVGAVLGGLPGAIFAVPLVAAVNAAVATLRGVPGPPGMPAVLDVDVDETVVQRTEA